MEFPDKKILRQIGDICLSILLWFLYIYKVVDSHIYIHMNLSLVAYMWFKLLQLRAIKLLHHHHHHDHQLRLGCCNVVGGAPLYIWWQLVWYQGSSR